MDRAWLLSGRRIRVRNGVAYLAGTVSRHEFLGTAGALQRDLSGLSDFFVLSLAEDGSLDWLRRNAIPRAATMSMKVYLDICCLNRLIDDHTQRRIRQEAEAVEFILGRMQHGAIQWVSSEALYDETDRNPDVEKRLENAALLALIAGPCRRSADGWLRSLRRTASGVRRSSAGGRSSCD